jgi:hypothetical protein
MVAVAKSFARISIDHQNFAVDGFVCGLQGTGAFGLSGGALESAAAAEFGAQGDGAGGGGAADARSLGGARSDGGASGGLGGGLVKLVGFVQYNGS